MTGEDLCRVAGITQIREALCFIYGIANSDSNSGITSITAGTGISVDNTNPLVPIINVDVNKFVTVDTAQNITATKTFRAPWADSQAIFGQNGQGGRILLVRGDGGEQASLGFQGAANSTLAVSNGGGITITQSGASSVTSLAATGTNGVVIMNASGASGTLSFFTAGATNASVSSAGTWSYVAPWSDYQASFGVINQGGRIRFMSGTDGLERLRVGFSGATGGNAEVRGLNNSINFTSNGTFTQLENNAASGYILLTASGTTAGQLRFQTGTLEKLRIFTNGNVVINSTGVFVDNGYLVDIAGSLRTQGLTELGSGLKLKPTTSSASTLTLTTTNIVYSFTGTTSIWTLPLLTGNAGIKFVIMNVGSGTLTMNTNNGIDNDIMEDGIAVNQITVSAGEVITIVHNSIKWVKY